MKHILIIDEENISTDGLIDLIDSHLKCRISCAKTCSEAIVSFRTTRFDLIILDLVLPVGDYEITKDVIKDDMSFMFGLQLLYFFRRENNNIPIIGYSCADSEEVRQAFLDSNAHFLCKLESNPTRNLVNIIKAI